jgi:hypothetical protein
MRSKNGSIAGNLFSSNEAARLNKLEKNIAQAVWKMYPFWGAFGIFMPVAAAQL